MRIFPHLSRWSIQIKFFSSNSLLTNFFSRKICYFFEKNTPRNIMPYSREEATYFGYFYLSNRENYDNYEKL